MTGLGEDHISVRLRGSAGQSRGVCYPGASLGSDYDANDGVIAAYPAAPLPCVGYRSKHCCEPTQLSATLFYMVRPQANCLPQEKQAKGYVFAPVQLRLWRVVGQMQVNI